MTTYFLDTNALVKLYAFDRTSYWTIGVVASRRPRHRIRATQLLERYRTGTPKALHTLDALHLASALIARAMLPESERVTFHFVSADRQLRGCAEDQGLTVIDPSHPPRPPNPQL